MRLDRVWKWLPMLIAVPIYASDDVLHEAIVDLVRRDAFTDCLNVDFSEGCEKSPADCFATMCNACQNVAIIAECCGLATDSAKLVCLNNAMANPAALTMTKAATGTSTSRASSITVAPVSGSAACAGVLSTWQSCKAQTSEFSMLPFNQQAQCLCYKSKALNASAYDGPWSTCLAYASVTSPALYSSLTQAWGADRAPCSKMGNSNITSVLIASSVWYIGYTIDPAAAKPTAQFSSQSSALPLMTATLSASTKPNSGCRSDWDGRWLGMTLVFSLIL